MKKTDGVLNAVELNKLFNLLMKSNKECNYSYTDYNDWEEGYKI